MAGLTKEQAAHLNQRITNCALPLRQVLTAKAKKPEPVAVAAARRRVQAWEADCHAAYNAADKAAREAVKLAQQAVLFGTATQALAAVEALEKQVA